MPHDLGATLDHDGVATEFILEPRIRAFGARAFIVSERLGWREFDFLATARLGTDSQSGECGPDYGCVLAIQRCRRRHPSNRKG